MTVTIDANKWSETLEAAMRLRRIEKQLSQLCDEIAMQTSGDDDGHFILGEAADDRQKQALTCVAVRLKSILR